jgi:lipopolysaccharide/colanic/teichoic acid biosynthesis glycosyltransferase
MATGVIHKDQTAALAPRSVSPRPVSYRRQKRIVDFVGASVVILLTLPLLLIAALLVKVTSRGPLLYVSKRVGLCGRVFRFYKLRSMYVDAEQRKKALAEKNEKEGPIFKMKDDPRITPVGRLIRKSSIDELPQLFNVLKGDMSLVGPRPPLVGEVKKYGDYEMQRLSIKPGLTCYWQIMGRSDLTFDEWMDLDHQYLKEMSLMTDLKIIAKTPKAVLTCRGAY